jgi:hypothetical protein
LWQVSLADDGGPAIRLEDDTGDVILCTPWDGELTDAEATGLPYAPLCDWSMFLRNPVQGNRTTREAVSDFLRDNIVFGDSLVNLIKGAFYEDAFMVSSEELETEEQVSGVELLGSALLSRTPVMRPAMGFDLIGAEAGMQAGNWYEVDGAPGIYASVMQPGMIAQSVFDVPGANWLDGVENGADVYLVAFDMDQFDIGYELGTDHPESRLVLASVEPAPRGGARRVQPPRSAGSERHAQPVSGGKRRRVLHRRLQARPRCVAFRRLRDLQLRPPLRVRAAGRDALAALAQPRHALRHA